MWEWLLIGGAAVGLGGAGAWSFRDLVGARSFSPRGWVREGFRRLERKDLEGAARAFAQALKAGTRAGDLACVSAGWRGMGLVRAAAGDKPGAEAALRAAIDAALQAGDPGAEAAALRDLARIFRASSRSREAEAAEARAAGLAAAA